jgi:hypothetical protein
MKNKLTLTTLAALAGFAIAGNAQTIIFNLADTDDVSLSHSSADTSASPPNAGSLDLGSGTFEWTSLATDSGGNTAEFSSGTFTSSDWGGGANYNSDSIDLTGFTSIDISVQFDGEFNNAPGEFSYFYYSLITGPSSTVTNFGVGVENTTYTDETITVSGIDVTGFDQLQVGFEFSHNGSSDFFNVDSFTVSAVPEPSAYALLSGMLGLTWVMLRRRRA